MREYLQLLERMFAFSLDVHVCPLWRFSSRFFDQFFSLSDVSSYFYYKCFYFQCTDIDMSFASMFICVSFNLSDITQEEKHLKHKCAV